MDKSCNSSRVGRLSLSRIDEDSIWEKSLQSSPSSSEELNGPEPCQTPEKAKERIRSLEEVVHNVQLDYDTLKEYTVLERQVFNFEKIADISQPDIVASLLNTSLQIDQRRRSLLMEGMDLSGCKMNLSTSDVVPVAMSECTVEELRKTIDDLQSENGKLKTLLEEKENRLKETMEEQSYCTENPIVIKMQRQIEDLSLQNKRYEENIQSLMLVKEAYEKLSTNETGEKMNISDLLSKISVLQEENNKLKLDTESNYRFKDEHAKLLESTEHLQTQFDTLQNECEELKSKVEVLKAQEKQMEEQNSILNSLKIELQLSENPEDNFLISLQKYVSKLQRKQKQAECEGDTIAILNNEIVELKNQLYNAKAELELISCKETNAGDFSLDSPEVVINGADNSNIVFGDHGEVSVKNLLAELDVYRSKMRELEASLNDHEANLISKDEIIVDLEGKLNLKNTKISNLYSKTNVLSSYLSVLTKHLETLTDNNNTLHLLVSEKSGIINRLENQLSGVRTKLKKFMEQKEIESEKLTDVSSFFFNLFDCNDSDLHPEESPSVVVNSGKNVCTLTSNDRDVSVNTSCLSSCETDKDHSITDILSVSKSIVEFSYCLNNLFSSANTSETNVGSAEWLKETSSYFYRLFDPANESRSPAENSELNETDNAWNNTSIYFKDHIISPNDISCIEKPSSPNNCNSTSDQSLENSSLFLCNLFDSFLSAKGNKTNNESVLNTSDYLGNLFKSQNLPCDKSLNITTGYCKNETVSNTSNYLGDLFNSHNFSINKTLDKTIKNGEGDSVLNASNYFGNLFKSRNMSLNGSSSFSTTSNNLSTPGNVTQNSDSLQGLQRLSSSVALNFSGNRFNESNFAVDHASPEIALCDGTLNSTAMFHGNNTCLEDPFKSISLDSTIIDKVAYKSPITNESSLLRESDDDFLSPDCLLQKIVDLKILLNQFENGIHDLSSHNLFAQITNPLDPFFMCLSSLMNSYTSVYDELKAVLKSFNINNSSPAGLEKSAQESSKTLNLTLKGEALGDKLHTLVSDLNEQTLVMSDLENQINNETQTSETLEETINQKEKLLEDLRSSLFNSEIETNGESVYGKKVIIQEIEPDYLQETVSALETEIQSLKTELRTKELEIEELTNKFSEELKAKDANVLELQSHCSKLVSGVKSCKMIIDSFNEELLKFENTSQSQRDSISAVLMSLSLDLTQPAVFENVTKQFSGVDREIEELVSGTLISDLGLEISGQPFRTIKCHLIRLVSEQICLENGLLEVLSEISVLKSLSDSKDLELSKLLEIKQQMEDSANQKAVNLQAELRSKQNLIEDAQKSVEDFVEDKKYFESELMQLMERNDLLTSQLEAKESDVVNLKREVEELTALKQNLMDQVNTLQARDLQSEVGQRELEQIRLELVELQKKLIDNAEYTAELEEKAKDLENVKQCADFKIIELNQNIDTLTSQLESKDIEIKNLTISSKNLEILKKDLEVLDAEKTSYEKRTFELMEEVKVLQAELTHNELHQQQIEALQARLVENEKALEEKKKTAIELENRLKEYEEDKKHFEAKLNQVMEDFEKSQEEARALAALEQSLAEITEDRDAKENRIQELTEQLNSFEEENNEKDKALQIAEEVCLKLSTTEQELEAKLAQVEDLQKKLCECEERRNDLEIKMAEFLEERENLKKETENLSFLKESLSKLTDDNVAKEKLIKKLMQELNDFKLDKDENARVKEVAEQTELKLAKTELELKEKESQIENLMKDFMEDQQYYEDTLLKLFEMVDELKSQISKIKPENDVSIFETSLVALEQTLTVFREEKVNRDRERNECNESKTTPDGRVLKAGTTEKEEAIFSLKEELNSLNREKLEKETEVSILLKKIDDYQAKVENLLNEKDRSLVIISDLESQLRVNESSTAIKALEDTDPELDFSEKYFSTLGKNIDDAEPKCEARSSRPVKTALENSEFEQLLKEVSDLKALNTKLEVDVVAVRDEKLRLTNDLKQKLAIAEEALSKSLSDIESRNERMNLLMQEVNDLHKCLEEKNSLIAKMEEQVVEMEQSRKTPEISEEFETKLKAKEQKIHDLSENLSSMEAELQAKSLEVSTLSVEVEKKSSEIGILEKSFSDVKEKLNKLNGMKVQLSKMEVQVKTSEDLIDVFQKKIDVFEEEKKKEEEEKTNLMKQVAMLRESVCSKTTQIEMLKAEIASISDSRDASFADPKDSVSKLKTELTMAKQNLIKEIKSLKANAQTDEIPFPELVTELMSVIMEKQKEVFNELISDSERFKSEIKFLKKTDKETKEWINKLESENNDLQSVINEKVIKLSSVEGKLSSVQNELSSKSSTVEDLQLQIKAKEDEIFQLESQLADVQNSLVAQQKSEELKLQTDAMSSLNDECNSMRQKLQKEEEMIAMLRKQIDEEVIKFTELNEECLELKRKLNETAVLKETLEKNLVCKDDEIHQLKENLERNAVYIDETNRLRSEYEEVLTVKESLTANIANLQHTVDEKSNAIKTLEDVVSQNVEEVTNLKKDLEEKSLQVFSLTEKINAKSSEIETLNAELAAGVNVKQTDCKPNQVSISEEKLQALMQAAKSTEESEGRINSLNAEVKALKNNNNRLQSEADEVSRVKMESNLLQNKIKDLTEEMSLLQSKLTLEKGNATIMKPIIKKLEEEKIILTEKLKHSEDEKTKLMEELEDVKSGSFDNSSSFNSSLDGSKKNIDNSPSNAMFKRNVKNEKLNRKNAALEKKVESLKEKEEKLHEIEQNLKALLPVESSSGSVLATISLLREKLVQADESFTKLSQELSVKDTVISQQANAKLILENRIVELTNILEQKQGEIASLSIDLKKSEETKKTLDEECVLTLHQYESLEQEYAEALKRESELKLKLHETTAITEAGLASEEDLMKVLKEKETISQENLVLTAQVRNLKNEKRQLVTDFYNLKTKSREIESSLIALKSKVNILEEEKKGLDSKNSSLTKKLIEVTDEKENLSSNLNTLLAKYDTLETMKKAACDDQITTLKNQIQKYKHELVEKNAKITMLELQIQSENFPYRSKVLELESSVASYKKKCEDLRSQLRRHQASVQESTVSAVQECGSCFARRTRGKSDVQTQTLTALHLDGERSSIVQANADAVLKDRVKKLEREHDTMKRLCRIRAAKISNLEQYIKQNNLPVPECKENPEPIRPVTKATERESNFSSRRVLNELIGGNSHQ